MLKVAGFAKNTLTKVAPVVGKSVASNVIKLPLTLAKMGSSMVPMIMSGVLGIVYLLIKTLK